MVLSPDLAMFPVTPVWQEDKIRLLLKKKSLTGTSQNHPLFSKSILAKLFTFWVPQRHSRYFQLEEEGVKETTSFDSFKLNREPDRS